MAYQKIDVSIIGAGVIGRAVVAISYKSNVTGIEKMSEGYRVARANSLTSHSQASGEHGGGQFKKLTNLKGHSILIE